jgi:internalin A
MKRLLTSLILIMLIGTLAACSPPASESGDILSSRETLGAASEKAIVTFTDPMLETMVRGSMGKPEGDIMVAEAEAVTQLNISNEWRRYVSEEATINDIGGLEAFKNLESLDLSFHAITDITPLAGMKKLTSLSLGGNPVADIAPLAGLTSLQALSLSGCAARDYSPLAKLVNLKFLMLDHATIADVSPLASLTKLKHLYLTGSPINNYFPLSDIYQNLEQKDFTIAFTLAELGFTMNDANNQASYGDVQRDGLSVNINHAEWGAPQSEDMTKCVKMDLMLDSGYTLVALYYPEISAYVFQMNLNGEQMNYIYNAADGTFMVDSNNRERFERMITEALGETDAEDILLAPIPIFNETIKNTFGMTADALYALPFEQGAALPSEQTPPPYALPYEQLGFTANADSAICLYEQTEPHYMQIAIHRPEWGVSPDEWNIEFHDSNVNGYKLVMQYFANEGKWHVYLEKDDVDCSFDDYPATDAKGWEYPDIETVHQMVGDAFASQGKELYYKPIAYFEQVVQERFGMSIGELYALPAGE